MNVSSIMPSALQQSLDLKISEHGQEQILNLLKRQIKQKPAETLLFFYGCYCVGTFIVSVGLSTVTGAIRGLLVVAPPTSSSISDVCDSRSLSCFSGALTGAYNGASDSLSFIAAPWARLFQPSLGSGTKKPVFKESSSQTLPSLDSLNGRSSIDSLSSEVTERGTFIPINSSHSTSTLGQWSPTETSEVKVVSPELKAENSIPDEENICKIMTDFYQLC